MPPDPPTKCAPNSLWISLAKKIPPPVALPRICFFYMQKKERVGELFFKGKEREKSEVQLDAWGRAGEKFFVRENGKR